MNYHYEILAADTVYAGFFRMREYRIRHELFSGGAGPEIKRECLERGHAVAVLPYDPGRDRVVLLEQFRVGALDFPGTPWLLEIVAGMIGDGEARADVARREAVEEAGCEILDLMPIFDYLVSPGGTSESIGLYCGRVDSEGLGGVHGLEHEHEDILVRVVAREEAVTMLREGRIASASAIIALQWLELNLARVRARWGAPGVG